MTYPKSKSSTPNLLYLISTFSYHTGTSAFKLRTSFAPMSSALLDLRSPVPSFDASLAFSLRNLGACKLAGVFSNVRVFSTWFLFVARLLRPYPPHSVTFNDDRNCWSIFGGGAPVSKTKWLGQDESNCSR